MLFGRELYGNCISILRQELDSMVRAIYLLPIDDLDLRGSFIEQTLNEEKWSFINHNGKQQKIVGNYQCEIEDLEERKVKE